MLLKCSVNWVRFGLFSSFCSLAQSSTSGIWRKSAGVEWRCSLEWGFKQCWPAKRQRLLYLDLIEELGIQESELICNLMTAEVVERPWPVRTQIHISSPDQMELNYPNDYVTFNIIFFHLQCRMTARIYAITALESYLAETPRAASGLRELV